MTTGKTSRFESFVCVLLACISILGLLCVLGLYATGCAPNTVAQGQAVSVASPQVGPVTQKAGTNATNVTVSGGAVTTIVMGIIVVGGLAILVIGNNNRKYVEKRIRDVTNAASKISSR